MKLLYILGSYFPAQSGGPNNTIHWQAKYLSKSGEDVTVASLKSGLQQNNINEHNINLNVENNIEGVKAFYFDFFKNRYLSFKFYFWMIKNIKKFDFVQLTSYFFPISWFAALLCNIYGIPFSLAPRGELEDNAMKYSSKIKKILHKTLLTFLYKKAKFILVTSPQELEFTKKFFHNKMKFELIPNYIDLKNTKPLCEEEIFNKKDILYLGRIHPKKGIENLIKAYHELSRNIINKHSLLIVGSGDVEYEKKLKDLAYSKDDIFKTKIIFLGHKQGKEKEELYKKSKVFVLPSYSENFGNVVLESLSFSTPVISSIFTPWKELENENCGYCINNHPSEIKNKIEYLLMLDEKEYLFYANNSYDFVNKKYDISRNINHLINIYNRYKNEN